MAALILTGVLPLFIISGRGRSEHLTYQTAAVGRGDIDDVVTVTGSVNAVNTIKVGSQLSGQVDELYVNFNDDVRRDQPIARLDQQSFRASVSEAKASLAVAEANIATNEAAVARARSRASAAQTKRAVLEAHTTQARATLRNASREFERSKSLHSKKALAESRLDDAEARLTIAAADMRAAEAEEAAYDQEIAMARAELQFAEAELAKARAGVPQAAATLALAEIALERTVIRSPIDGVIVSRDIDRGQTVAASFQAPTLFTIAEDLRRTEVHAKVDEADIGAIWTGQRATFTVDAFPDRTFSGEVMQIRKAAKEVENVITYTVVIGADNSDLLLLPGMTALVRIGVAKHRNVLLLPNAALRFTPPPDVAVAPETSDRQLPGAEHEGDGAVVWTLNSRGVPSPVHVRVGASHALNTQLVAGLLTEGEEVIIGLATRGPAPGLLSKLVR